MLKNGLYLYAMLLFSFTALQGVEKCPESKDASIARNKCPYAPTHPTNEEASAFYALLEDDNEELNELTDKQFPLCNQDENNPKELNKNRVFFACGEDEEEEITPLPLR